MLSSNSIFSFWLFIELNTVSFLVLILFKNLRIKLEGNKELINQSFFYFILQSCVSIVILLGLSLKNYFFLEINSLVTLCVIFKLGIFPFYFWVIKLMKYLDWFGIFMLLGPQKLFLIILLFTNFNNLINYIFWFSLFFGSLIILNSFCLEELLLGSSIAGVLVIEFIYNSSVLIFFLFFSFYIFCIFHLIKIYKLDSSVRGRINFLFSLFFLSSPFFPFFILKFQLVKFLFDTFLVWEFALFWGGMFITFLGYLFFFFYNFFFIGKTYVSNYKISGFLFFSFFNFFFFFF